MADHVSRLDELLDEATAAGEPVGPSDRALSALIEEERALPIEDLEEARNRPHLWGRKCRRQLLSDGAEVAHRRALQGYCMPIGCQ